MTHAEQDALKRIGVVGCPSLDPEEIADAVETVYGALRERAERLHKLIDLARNWIDPEEHAEWDETASADLVACDEKITALQADVARLREALTDYHENGCMERQNRHGVCCYAGDLLATLAATEPKP